MLQERVKKLFEVVMAKADRETLMMLNPLLLRLK